MLSGAVIASRTGRDLPRPWLDRKQKRGPCSLPVRVLAEFPRFAGVGRDGLPSNLAPIAPGSLPRAMGGVHRTDGGSADTKDSRGGQRVALLALGLELAGGGVLLLAELASLPMRCGRRDRLVVAGEGAGELFDT